METVQEAVERRREQDADAGEQGDAAVEGIDRLEPLAAGAADGVDRAHAAEDHRGVDQRVEPRQFAVEVIADDADRQRATDDDRREPHTLELATPINLRRRQLLVFALELHGTSTTFPKCSRASMRSCARRASASGITESTTGFSRPSRTNFSTSTSSERRPIHEP